MSDSEILWTVAPQAPLSGGFPRHESWSGWPFPFPGDLPDSGIEPTSSALQVEAPYELKKICGGDWLKMCFSQICEKGLLQKKKVSDISPCLEHKLFYTHYTSTLSNGRFLLNKIDLEFCFEYLEAVCWKLILIFKFENLILFITFSLAIYVNISIKS